MSTTLIPPTLCIAYILPIWPNYLEQHPLGRSSASTKVSIPRRLLLDIIRQRRRPNDEVLHQRSASRIFMPQHPAVRHVRSTQNIDTYTLLCVVTNLRSPSAFQYRGAGILSCSVPTMWVFTFKDPIFDIIHTAFQPLWMLSTIAKGARLLIRRSALRFSDPQHLANLLCRPLAPFDFQQSTLYAQEWVRFLDETAEKIIA